MKWDFWVVLKEERHNVTQYCRCGRNKLYIEKILDLVEEIGINKEDI